MTTIEPVRKRISVPLDQTQAFELFTDGIGTWWPMATHSASMDAAASVRMEAKEGGRLLEDTPDGSVETWGTITQFEPPSLVAFTWHPAGKPDRATQVQVSFTSGGGSTDIELLHTEWENLGGDAAAQMREAYEQGWDPVLGQYRDAAG
jgi:uncharacterized protein YndB with AHSA1/START domain